MGKLVISSLVVLFLVSLSSVCYVGLGEDKHWCVTKPSTDDTELNKIINYACENLGSKQTKTCKEGWAKDCSICSTLVCKASLAANYYYQTNNKQPHECDFDSAGLVSITDPSYDNCKFDYIDD